MSADGKILRWSSLSFALVSTAVGVAGFFLGRGSAGHHTHSESVSSPEHRTQSISAPASVETHPSPKRESEIQSDKFSERPRTPAAERTLAENLEELAHRDPQSAMARD